MHKAESFSILEGVGWEDHIVKDSGGGAARPYCEEVVHSIEGATSILSRRRLPLLG